MKIKYIVDRPAPNSFTITDTRDGNRIMITGNLKTVRLLLDYFVIGVSNDQICFSAKADVALRSVDQKEL